MLDGLVINIFYPHTHSAFLLVICNSQFYCRFFSSDCKKYVVFSCAKNKKGTPVED